jgi:hypothetical protein
MVHKAGGLAGVMPMASRTRRSVRIEDVSHAELSMRYVGVLNRALRHIHAALIRSGQETIDQAPLRRQLESTFVLVIRTDHDLTHKVDGRLNEGKTRDDAYNGSTNGWLYPADVDIRVHNKYRDPAFRPPLPSS